MSTDLILGPVGVLPPGEWKKGAAVAGDRSGWWSSAPDVGPIGILVSASDEAACVVGDDDDWTGCPTERLCLDLTTGCLGHGTRALLALVAGTDAEQPDCPPTWRGVVRRDFGMPDVRAWLLSVDDDTVAVFAEDGAEDFGAVFKCDVCLPIGFAPDPRRALAMALDAAS